MDQPYYPILTSKMVERGIKKSAVACAIRCSPRALQNKLNGRTDFSWSEICIIQRQFFPDLTKEALLHRQ